MSVIKAGTTLTTAYTVEADTTGALEFKTGPSATLAMSISASGVVTFPATTGFDIASANITNLTSTTLTVSKIGIFPAGSATVAAITTTGDTNNGIFFPATDVTAITTAGSERLRVDASGNMGLGVTPSSWGSSYRGLQVGYGGAIFAGNNTFPAFVGISANKFIDNTPADIYLQNGSATEYFQNSGQHVWRIAASGTAGNAITFTQVLAVEKAKSLALEGATSQSGTGITFPATQSASSNANTLDDYEEGTWTPTLLGSSTNPTVTYGAQGGKYTKIGDIVYFNLYVYSTAYSGGSGSLDIGGLPFTSAGGATDAPILSGWTSGVNWPAGYTQLAPLVLYGGTRIWMSVVGDDVGYTRLSVGDYANGDEIRISGWYYV